MPASWCRAFSRKSQGQNTRESGQSRGEQEHSSAHGRPACEEVINIGLSEQCLNYFQKRYCTVLVLLQGWIMDGWIELEL